VRAIIACAAVRAGKNSIVKDSWFCLLTERQQVAYMIGRGEHVSHERMQAGERRVAALAVRPR